MQEFIFRPVTLYDEKIVMDYRNEFLQTDFVIKGTKNLENFENYQDFYRNLELKKENEPNINQYLLIRKTDSKLVGMAIIRKELTETNILTGGNIGLGIRPSERRKGYGDIILKFSLEECKKIGMKKVLITCRDENIASAKNIEKNGGKFERTAVSKVTGALCRRYWINL